MGGSPYHLPASVRHCRILQVFPIAAATPTSSLKMVVWGAGVGGGGEQGRDENHSREGSDPALAKSPGTRPQSPPFTHPS